MNTAYLVIPSAVAYDERLNYFDKLLYGQIYSLTRQYGYCWATNEFLANKLGGSPSYVTKAIKRLKDLDYLIVDMDNTQIYSKKRKIYVNYDTLDKDRFNNLEEPVQTEDLVL